MKGKSKAKAAPKAAPKSEGADVLAAAKGKGKMAPPFSGPSKKTADEMSVEPGQAKRRLDKPGRKTGGRVGADLAPLSSANRTTGGPDC